MKQETTIEELVKEVRGIFIPEDADWCKACGYIGHFTAESRSCPSSRVCQKCGNYGIIKELTDI